jgi:hypothetical protein
MTKRTRLRKVKDIAKTPSPEPETKSESLYKPPPPLLQKKARKEPSRLVLEACEPRCEYLTPTKAKV